MRVWFARFDCRQTAGSFYVRGLAGLSELFVKKEIFEGEYDKIETITSI